MSTEHEANRIVRSWMREGITALPDRVLDEVLDQLPATPQRRATWWPVRRLFDMNTALAVGLATAAVVVVALVGATLFASPDTGIGDGVDVPTSTPSTTPMAWPTSQGTELAAGTYLTDGPTPFRTTITVPEGWIACGTGPIESIACAGPRDPRAVDVVIIENLVADPCDSSRALLDPPIGGSVDDLVTGLSNLPGFAASEPTDVTVDGFSGKQLELTAPSQPACVLDENGFGVWATASRTNGVGPGETNLLRILDVNGERVVIAAAYQPVASAAEVAEVRAIFESVRVGP